MLGEQWALSLHQLGVQQIIMRPQYNKHFLNIQRVVVLIYLLSGMIYFGGGPVVRVPFAWYHVCLTINYMQSSKEAIRSVQYHLL